MTGQVLQVFVEAIRFVGRPEDEWDLMGWWNLVEDGDLRSSVPPAQQQEHRIDRESVKEVDVAAELAGICATLAQEHEVEVLELSISRWIVPSDDFSEAAQERRKDKIRLAIAEILPDIKVYIGRSSSDLGEEMEELHRRIQHD